MTCVHFCGMPVFSKKIPLPDKGGMNRTEVHVWKITNFCSIADLSCCWGSQRVRSRTKPHLEPLDSSICNSGHIIICHSRADSITPTSEKRGLW